MRIQRIAIAAVFAAMLAVVPLSTASAQYYPPCTPFPLSWPFCIVGAVVGTTAAVVTAPFRAVGPPPPPYYYGYYPRPVYAPPPYGGGGAYPPASYNGH
jgi:hypothetical protein